jgi:hypothetical protein
LPLTADIIFRELRDVIHSASVTGRPPSLERIPPCLAQQTSLADHPNQDRDTNREPLAGTD